MHVCVCVSREECDGWPGRHCVGWHSRQRGHQSWRTHLVSEGCLCLNLLHYYSEDTSLWFFLYFFLSCLSFPSLFVAQTTLSLLPLSHIQSYPFTLSLTLWSLLFLTRTDFKSLFLLPFHFNKILFNSNVLQTMPTKTTTMPRFGSWTMANDTKKDRWFYCIKLDDVCEDSQSSTSCLLQRCRSVATLKQQLC